MKRLLLILSLVAAVNLMSMASAGHLLESGNMMNIEVASNFDKQEGEVVQVPKAIANQFGVFTDQMGSFAEGEPLAARVEPSVFKKLLEILQKANLKRAISRLDSSSLVSVLEVADYLLLDKEKVDLIIGEVAEKLGNVSVDGLLAIAAPIQDLVIKKWLEGNKDKVSAAGCPLDWSLKQILDGHTGSVNSVAISGNGQTIVSGSDDETVKIWNLGGDGSWVLKQTLDSHAGPVNSVAISGNDQTIVSGSVDKAVKIWSLGGDGRWVLKQTLDSHAGPVNSVAILNDGQTIISSSDDDDTVQIWILDGDGSWVYKQTLGAHANWVNLVAISNDGQTIASASYGISVWSAPEDCKLTLPIVYAIEKEELTLDERDKLIEEIDFNEAHPRLANYLNDKLQM
jgi:hypothetical protein